MSIAIPIVTTGRPEPLGSTCDSRGVNFAVFSSVAERVEVCLFDNGTETRVTLPEVDGFVWHGFIPNIEPGQRYRRHVAFPGDEGNEQGTTVWVIEECSACAAARGEPITQEQIYRGGGDAEA